MEAEAHKLAVAFRMSKRDKEIYQEVLLPSVRLMRTRAGGHTRGGEEGMA